MRSSSVNWMLRRATASWLQSGPSVASFSTSMLPARRPSRQTQPRLPSFDVSGASRRSWNPSFSMVLMSSAARAPSPIEQTRAALAVGLFGHADLLEPLHQPVGHGSQPAAQQVLVRARAPYETEAVLHVDEVGQLGDGGGHELLDAVVAQEDLADLFDRPQALVAGPHLGELLLGFTLRIAQLPVRSQEGVGEHAGEQRDEEEGGQADAERLLRPGHREVTAGDRRVVDEHPGALQRPRRDVQAAAGRRGHVGGPRRQEQAGGDDGPEVEDGHRAQDPTGVHDAGRHEDGVEHDHGDGDAGGVAAADEEQERGVGDHEHGQDDQHRHGHGALVEEREDHRGDERGQAQDDPRRQDLVELSADFQTVASRRPSTRLV